MVSEFVLNKEFGVDESITYTHYDDLLSSSMQLKNSTTPFKRVAYSFYSFNGKYKTYAGFIFENLDKNKCGGFYSTNSYTALYVLDNDKLYVTRGNSCYFSDISYSNDLYINDHSPTVDPTVDPTVVPTDDPTVDPTILPINHPIFSKRFSTTSYDEISFFNGAWKYKYGSSTELSSILFPRTSEGLLNSNQNPFNFTSMATYTMSLPITKSCLTIAK